MSAWQGRLGFRLAPDSPPIQPRISEKRWRARSRLHRGRFRTFFLEMGVFASCFRDLQDGDFIELRKLTKCHQNVLYFRTENIRCLHSSFILI